MLANETLSTEPMGEVGVGRVGRGGGIVPRSSSDKRNAIRRAPALSETNRVTNQRVSPAEEFQQHSRRGSK